MVGGAMPRVLQALFLALWASSTRQSKKIRLVAEGPNEGLADLKDLVEAGKVVPVIDRTYHLSEAPEAFRYFVEGRHKGKVAITLETWRD